MPSPRSLVSIVFLLLGGAKAAQKCYGLDGTQLDSTYGPCKPSAANSGCCAIHRTGSSADICLDNGLCMATADKFMGTVWQNGCTDPTRSDPGCPKLCPDVRDNFNGLRPVLAWNIQMCDYGKYCCREVNDRNNCCNNATAPQVTTNFLGAFQFQASTAGASSTTSAAAVTVTGTAAAPTGAPSVVGTAVSSGTPFPLSTASPTAMPPSSCPKDRSAAVGGALGGVLGAVVIGLAGIIVWMYKKEKHQRRLKEHYEEQFGHNFAYRRTIVVEADSVPATPEEKDKPFAAS